MRLSSASPDSFFELRNRQKLCAVDLRLLRKIIFALLKALAIKRFELGVRLVESKEMTLMNEEYLCHAGSTDVIAFNYSSGPNPKVIQGDIVICMTDAVEQARRFRTSWQAELARYLIHGVLHLQGYDDRRPSDRRRMKSEEERLLGEMESRFPLCDLKRSNPRFIAKP